jgi:hypothetical protein
VLAGISLNKLVPRQRRALYPPIAILVFVLLSEMSVYLVAPNLPWLIDTSLDRLLLQVWPTCVFVALATWASASAAVAEGDFSVPQRSPEPLVRQVATASSVGKGERVQLK